MKAFLKSVTTGLLALLLTASVAFAQDRGAFRQEELDQMLAPIALYPDPLLSQILMASTYPLEVVQAARWSRSNSHLRGQEAVRAVEPMDWDPSVKSLVAFPQILHRMDEQLDWTQRLGEAFLAQEPHVMDTIQGLRQRAEAAGNLRSNEQVRVARQDDYIMIEPARPEAVYVPYYNPAVVYGSWWWPAYPPVYWGPPPGYYAAPAFAPGFFWGPAIVISTGFFFGHVNWHHRHVTVIHKHVQVTHHTRFGKPHTIVTSKTDPVAWKHDPVHRRGVPYRHAAPRHEFGRPGASSGDARRDHRRPDAAPMAHHRDGGRPADFGEGRPDGRRDSVANREGREAAPNRAVPQGNDKRADERGRAHFEPDARGSRPARPTAPGNDRRSELIRDDTRVQPRSMPPQPAPVAPGPRTDARPASAAPSGDTRHARIPEPVRPPALRNAGDQGRFARQAMPMRDSVAARPGPSPAIAVPNGNGRQRAVPEQRARQPEARAFSDRGHASRQNMTLRNSAPAPRQSASGGSPAPRLGNGSHRSGGGAIRQQSRGAAVR